MIESRKFYFSSSTIYRPDIVAKAEKQKTNQNSKQHRGGLPAIFTPRIVGQLADEIAKTMLTRLPSLIPHPRSKRKKPKKNQKLENGFFLDTSAIIDGRIFDVIHLGLLSGYVVVIDSVLLELKHIADAQDTVRRERGRKGLEYLEKLKKVRFVKVHVLDDGTHSNGMKKTEVDELIIQMAKTNKGRIITCDYNLEKKASIQNISAVNVNALANSLKVTAVPGEALHIKILHQGKDPSQGVGYLDDGTMIVVEQGADSIEKTIDVVISRVIQTATGRILFAKKI